VGGLNGINLLSHISGDWKMQDQVSSRVLYPGENFFFWLADDHLLIVFLNDETEQVSSWYLFI